MELIWNSSLQYLDPSQNQSIMEQEQQFGQQQVQQFSNLPVQEQQPGQLQQNFPQQYQQIQGSLGSLISEKNVSQKRKLSDVTADNQPLQHQGIPRNIQPVKPHWVPGTGAQRLSYYMSQINKKPKDNNIDFWRNFVAEFFVPNAKKRLCISQYEHGTYNGFGVQKIWTCKLCKIVPCCGFEASPQILPRLLKIKYESGPIEEYLHLASPRDIQTADGLILLNCKTATEETVFDEVRVVRYGQLRVLFSSDLKICFWEYCVRRHEEFVSRRRIIPSAVELGKTVQMFEAAKEDTTVEVLKSYSTTFLSSASQLRKSLNRSLTNSLGYPKRYMRSIEISEVVSSLKDLMDYSYKNGTAPRESLLKYTQSFNKAFGNTNSGRQPQQQQRPSSLHPSTWNSFANPSYAPGNSSTSMSVVPSTGLIFHGGTQPMRENQMKNPGFPCAGDPIQLPYSGPSTLHLTAQPIPSFPFSAPTPSPSPSPSNDSYHTSFSALGGTSSLASAAAKLHINSENSTMHLSSDKAEIYNSTDSMQNAFQESVVSTQLGVDGGIAGAGNIGNSARFYEMYQENGQIIGGSGFPSLAGGTNTLGGSSFPNPSDGTATGETNSNGGSSYLTPNGVTTFPITTVGSNSNDASGYHTPDGGNTFPILAVGTNSNGGSGFPGFPTPAGGTTFMIPSVGSNANGGSGFPTPSGGTTFAIPTGGSDTNGGSGFPTPSGGTTFLIPTGGSDTNSGAGFLTPADETTPSLYCWN